MTRKDKCCACGNAVADMDLCCDDCGRSYCSGCTVGTDPLSRFCLLRAQWLVYYFTTFTLGELKQLEKDLPSLVDRERYTVPEIREIVRAYDDMAPDSTLLSRPHQERVQLILSDIGDVMEEEAGDDQDAFPFVCSDCRYPSVKELYVVANDPREIYSCLSTAVKAMDAEAEVAAEIEIFVYERKLPDVNFVKNTGMSYFFNPKTRQTRLHRF